MIWIIIICLLLVSVAAFAGFFIQKNSLKKQERLAKEKWELFEKKPVIYLDFNKPSTTAVNTVSGDIGVLLPQRHNNVEDRERDIDWQLMRHKVAEPIDEEDIHQLLLKFLKEDQNEP